MWIVESFLLWKHCCVCMSLFSPLTVAGFYLSGLPSRNADTVELDPAALPVCGAAHKGEHRLFRGMWWDHHFCPRHCDFGWLTGNAFIMYCKTRVPKVQGGNELKCFVCKTQRIHWSILLRWKSLIKTILTCQEKIFILQIHLLLKKYLQYRESLPRTLFKNIFFFRSFRLSSEFHPYLRIAWNLTNLGHLLFTHNYLSSRVAIGIKEGCGYYIALFWFYSVLTDEGYTKGPGNWPWSLCTLLAYNLL